MTLWIILTLMVALASVAVAVPLVRRYENRGAERDAVLAVLRDQIAEIDAQVAAGTVPPAEAEALRTEVRRRLLTESRISDPTVRPLGAQGLGRIAFGLVAIVALSATGLYALMGRPELSSKPASAAPVTSSQDSNAGEVAALVGQLEARMAQNPNDPEGWRMLGWSYFQTGRFPESAQAYRKAVALAPTAPGFQSAYGEALVQAAQGAVTPEAATAFEAAKRLDPNDARARYFLAVLKDQRGDRKAAIDDWVQLLNEAPADAPWAPDLRQFVERIARESSIDLTGRLKPAATAAAPTAAPGPTPDQVAAASTMPAQDRQAMIRGMVDGLDARLQANPRDTEGWVRLMRARMVLGERDRAGDALRRGLAAYADSSADQAKLREAAKSLGIPGA